MRNREPATEEDARNGSAAFFVPESTRSKVFDLGVALPIGAALLEEVGEENPVPAGTRVQLIQADILDDLHVLLGFYESRLVEPQRGLTFLSLPSASGVG